MAALNYAKEYQQALEQEFPYVLYFGALFATPNNGRYRWVNSNVIEIPTITTTGRVDGDRRDGRVGNTAGNAVGRAGLPQRGR